LIGLHSFGIASTGPRGDSLQEQVGVVVAYVKSNIDSATTNVSLFRHFQ